MTPGTWPPLRVTMRDVGFEARDLRAVYCILCSLQYIIYTVLYSRLHFLTNGPCTAHFRTWGDSPTTTMRLEDYLERFLLSEGRETGQLGSFSPTFRWISVKKERREPFVPLFRS